MGGVKWVWLRGDGPHSGSSCMGKHPGAVWISGGIFVVETNFLRDRVMLFPSSLASGPLRL